MHRSKVYAEGITIVFALDSPRKSPRFTKVVDLAPGSGWWGHYVRITDLSALDDELFAWLKESYDQFGMRGRLRGARPSRTNVKRRTGKKGA